MTAIMMIILIAGCDFGGVQHNNPFKGNSSQHGGDVGVT